MSSMTCLNNSIATPHQSKLSCLNVTEMDSYNPNLKFVSYIRFGIDTNCKSLVSNGIKVGVYQSSFTIKNYMEQ